MKSGKDLRNLSQKEKEQDLIREKAIELVKKKISHSEVARLLGVSRQSVGKWCKNYKHLGKKSFKSKKRGGTQEPKLKGYQASTISRIIREKNPEQLKLPIELWTREAVQKLIKKKFDIDVCLSTVSNYLSKWGFTAQKPYKKAQEQNSEQVKKWLEEEYPEIEKRAKKENASIFWGDESGLRSTHSAGKSYSPKGKTPEKKISAKRLSINMISAISNGGKLYFKTYTGKFVSGVFIDFMKRVIKQSKKKIFLIVDNLAVHKSAKVKTWVEENKSRIELFFLPPYSPEMNPDELLNQDLKANIFKSKRPEDINDLKSILVNQLKSYQKNTVKIRNYFNAEKVSYAKAS